MFIKNTMFAYRISITFTYRPRRRIATPSNYERFEVVSQILISLLLSTGEQLGAHFSTIVH